MFDPTSRYAGLEIASVTIADGRGGTREVRYVRRRLVPPAHVMATLAEHTVHQADRLDAIAARHLGDPTQFWRICDANVAMNPSDLTAPSEVGKTLRIPVPMA